MTLRAGETVPAGYLVRAAETRARAAQDRDKAPDNRQARRHKAALLRTADRAWARRSAAEPS